MVVVGVHRLQMPPEGVQFDLFVVHHFILDCLCGRSCVLFATFLFFLGLLLWFWLLNKTALFEQVYFGLVSLLFPLHTLLCAFIELFEAMHIHVVFLF
jgi:hypothetical protein